MILSALVAVSKNNVIGKNNTLPWHCSADLKYFKRTTLNAPIIMGRNCYNSIGRPLPQRTNIVLTRDKTFKEDKVIVCHSIQEAIDFASETGAEECFIIGGGDIYQQTQPLWNKLYYTEIKLETDGDTYFPELDWDQWQLLTTEIHLPNAQDPCDCVFNVYERI